GGGLLAERVRRARRERRPRRRVPAAQGQSARHRILCRRRPAAAPRGVHLTRVHEHTTRLRRSWHTRLRRRRPARAGTARARACVLRLFPRSRRTPRRAVQHALPGDGHRSRASAMGPGRRHQDQFVGPAGAEEVVHPSDAVCAGRTARSTARAQPDDARTIPGHARKLTQLQHGPPMTYASEAGDFSIALAGDCMLTRRLSVFDEPAFLALVKTFRDCDIGTANLESVVRHWDEGTPGITQGTYMTTPPELLDEYKCFGISMFGCPNNHAFDYGEGGVLATLKHLDAAGFAHAGIGRNLAEARMPGYRDTRGGRVAILAATATFRPWNRAGAQRPDLRGRPGINPFG